MFFYFAARTGFSSGNERVMERWLSYDFGDPPTLLLSFSLEIENFIFFFCF